MNRHEEPAGDNRRIDLAAAEWLIKRDRGFTAAEQDEYFQWLAADPRHGEWIARHRRTWGSLDALAQWRPEHSGEPNPDLLAIPARRRRWFAPAVLALAACLVLVVWSSNRTPGTVSPALPAALAVGNEQRVLEDGSVIALNPGAVVEVDYTAAERRVRLVSGEARFTVAKDAARPFLVRARGVDVRAVGTVFNVRLADAAVEVLVTEGRVRVDDAVRGRSLLAPLDSGEIPLLVAGQKIVVDTTPAATAPVAAVPASAAEVTRLLAWQPQTLEFDSTPLAGVVAEFNRHNAVQLVVTDPEIASLPIVASFRPENVDGFVRLLERSAGIRGERTGDTITLRKAPGAKRDR